MQDLAGQTLGKYRLLERIGKGGMSVVYKAFQPGLERHVAVKALLPHLADSEDFVRRFRREAQAVADLRHPNIVQVFDFDYDQPSDTYYMVMEYVEGETLKARLARLNRAGERLPPGDVVAFFEGLLAGVGYAHRQGMVHRDLKPANIMFAAHGRTVLTDFGIARILGGERFTLTGFVMGTPVYMSPEQGLGESGDERSDLYSLGIVLYESLTGQVPYDADTPYGVMQKHLNQPVPDLRQALGPPDALALEPVIEKALAKSPTERFQTAEEMWGALEQAGRRLPGSHAGQALPAAVGHADDASRATVVPLAPSHKRPTAPARTRARLPASLWAVAAVALGLALGGWFFYYNTLGPARLDADLQTAQAQLAAGDYAAALQAFDSVLARDPDGVEALLGRADALLGMGQPDVALETIESAVELAPNAPQVFVTRGRYRLLYTSGPDVDASLRDFETALYLQPGYAPAYLARGWAILYFQHDAAAALPDLREAARLAADDPEAHRTLAAALSQSGDPAAALEEMQAALQLKSDDPDYFVESAVMRHALDDPAGAAADLDAAIALQPEAAPYYAMRAYLNFERADFDGALADAEHALRLQPGYPAALYARGLAHYRLTNFSEALADLDAVLAHEAFEYQEPFLSVEGLREINLDRALVLQAMPGREAEALAAFDASAAAQPDWFAVYYYRGVFLAEQRNASAAQADLELALQLAPDAEWRELAQAALDALGD